MGALCRFTADDPGRNGVPLPEKGNVQSPKPLAARLAVQPKSAAADHDVVVSRGAQVGGEIEQLPLSAAKASFAVKMEQGVVFFHRTSRSRLKIGPAQREIHNARGWRGRWFRADNCLRPND